MTRYVVTVTDEMINNEITRLQNRYGNMKDQEYGGYRRKCIEYNFY